MTIGSAAGALPIDDVLPQLLAVLGAGSSAVLEAPPGAGKTTRVPLALLDAPFTEGKRIVMLEPRRLAARAAASYMARTLGGNVGDTVGYRVRGDARVSRRTRIEVVTEGVLPRLLAEDAALEEYAVVVFDEFHERSLHADLGLALVLESQRHLRPELRILVMSATLDGTAVASLIGDVAPAPVVRSAGRMHPVETLYRPPRAGERLEQSVARVVAEAVSEQPGDVLVFLPGASEQRRVSARLAASGALDARVNVHTLHGAMPLAEQDAALAPAPAGARKVVLATSVAETSLTIEGVRVVVDSGWSRLPRFEPRAGMTRLDTVRVSRASAEQRRGRAGRTAPGACYRVWDQHEEFGFQQRTRPEILEGDLSSLALELAAAGIPDPTVLAWLDVPPAGAFAGARELLAQLGALDATGRITEHGKRMAAMPLAPRLSHLLIDASRRGLARLGAEIAALLEERDILRSESGGRSGDVAADIRIRVEALRDRELRDRELRDRELRDRELRDRASAPGIDRDALFRIRQNASELTRRLSVARDRARSHADSPRATGAQRATSDSAWDSDLHETGSLLALAFPDRVARRRPGDGARYLLRNGTGASLPRHDPLAGSEWIAVAELDGNPPDYRVVRAAPLTREEVERDFGEQLTHEEMVAWHDDSSSVRAIRRTMLGAISVDEVVVGNPPADRVREALLAHVADIGIARLPWSNGARALRERIAFLHFHDASWPDVSDAALVGTLDEWLGPHVDGLRKWSELEKVDWNDALLSLLPWNKRTDLDRLAPSHLEVPSGSRIALDYSDPAAPSLAVKLQEVFGWTSTPMLLEGRVPVTLELLSPAARPVQVTRDLAGFWRTSYFDVRKEMRGRYPRHPWPDDPLTATATRRVKPRGT